MHQQREDDLFPSFVCVELLETSEKKIPLRNKIDYIKRLILPRLVSSRTRKNANATNPVAA
jgi:hypothetical protein